jgi:hypothetical protein
LPVASFICASVGINSKKPNLSFSLSFNEAVHGCYDDLPSIMQCLSLLEKDVVATGLLKKMKNVRFGTSLFILKEILPILAKLSKTFQAGR